MAEHNLLGAEAERKALAYLSEKGYQLLKKKLSFSKSRGRFDHATRYYFDLC